MISVRRLKTGIGKEIRTEFKKTSIGKVKKFFCNYFQLTLF